MLAAMSARELAEWAAYFKGRHALEALVRDGVEPALAYRMVWDPRPEDRA
jgi:hypothetical protein